MAYITNVTSTTLQKRRQLKALQDEFCTFSWGGDDAFENFGAFIINEKNGSLKFYNGSEFSNEYTQPQFNNAGGVLQGVTFKRQQISFTIGVYWISIEDYRKMLNWLHPLKVSYLQFGFNPKFRYDVKLSNLTDSTRWIVGRENGEPRYYTEMKLSFDVQGQACAKGVQPYQFFSKPVTQGDIIQNADRYWSFQTDAFGDVVGKVYLNSNTNDFIQTDLETPLQIKFSLNLESDGLEANYFSSEKEVSILGSLNALNDKEFMVRDKHNDKEIASINSTTLTLKPAIDDSPGEYDIYLYAGYEVGQKEYEVPLCSFTLQHLALFIEKGYSLNFTYFSETGLIFLDTNESGAGTLLSQQTFTDSGEFLVKRLETYKFMLPGEFDYPEFYKNNANRNNIFIKLKYSKKGFKDSVWQKTFINHACYENQPILIECYPRTNVI